MVFSLFGVEPNFSAGTGIFRSKATSCEGGGLYPPCRSGCIYEIPSAGMEVKGDRRPGFPPTAEDVISLNEPHHPVNRGNCPKGLL